MIEKIKRINNPLTIIAIFAALAEIASTFALATLEPELQKVFIWFVMGFPTVLVVLFFLTLNFNPKVLYAPSDFKNEENFLSTFLGTHSQSDKSVVLTKENIDAVKPELLDKNDSKDEQTKLKMARNTNLLEARGSFFNSLSHMLRPRLFDGKITSLLYSPKTEEFNIVIVEVNKAELQPGKVDTLSYIIQFIPKDEKTTQLKFIGYNIADEDPAKFAERVNDIIVKETEELLSSDPED